VCYNWKGKRFYSLVAEGRKMTAENGLVKRVSDDPDIQFRLPKLWKIVEKAPKISINGDFSPPFCTEFCTASTSTPVRKFSTIFPRFLSQRH